MAYNALQARKIALNNAVNGTPQNTPFNPYSNSNGIKEQFINLVRNKVKTSPGVKIGSGGFEGGGFHPISPPIQMMGTNNPNTPMSNDNQSVQPNMMFNRGNPDANIGKIAPIYNTMPIAPIQLMGQQNSNDDELLQKQINQAYSKMSQGERGDYDRANVEANAEVMKNYHGEKALLEQILQQKLAMLEQSKRGIHQVYNDQVRGQNINNKQISNKMDNEYLKRSLGRSSVATTGLTEQQLLNDRAVQDINNRRSNSLSEVEMNKLNSNFEYVNGLKALDNDKRSKITALTRELADKYYDRRYREGRDKVADEHWTKDYDFRSNRAKVDDEHWNKDYSFKQNRASIDDSHWEKDFGFKQKSHNDSIALQKQQLAQQAAANAARNAYYNKSKSNSSNNNAREAAAALDITLAEIKNRVPSSKRTAELNILATQASYLPEPYRSQILGKITDSRPFTGGRKGTASPTWHP